MTIPLIDNAFPWVEWPTVRGLVDKAWDPTNNPHHLLCGGTGSGKSYLGINGILKPMCSTDRVLIVDTKGDDETTSSVGKAVRELPQNTWYKGLMRKEQPMDNWFRLVTWDGHTQNLKAKEQVGSTIIRCVKEGNWVIFLDEAAEVCLHGNPNLNLGGVVGWGMKKGRYKKVPFINATQGPVWIPRWLIDQSSFVWGGRIRDKERHKRMADVMGMSVKDELHYITELKKREWILSADPIDAFYRTIVTE